MIWCFCIAELGLAQTLFLKADGQKDTIHCPKFSNLVVVICKLNLPSWVIDYKKPNQPHTLLPQATDWIFFRDKTQKLDGHSYANLHEFCSLSTGLLLKT